MEEGKVLKFGKWNVKPKVRGLEDMKRVLYDSKWASSAVDEPAYFMYRDLALDEDDRECIEKERLRYDITVIPPKKLGVEYAKTLGHYHPKPEKQSASYPEVYQVLEGEAHYLLQMKEGDRITDAILVRAKKGDNVLIPPDYGHVTINPSSRVLKMANWVCRGFESDYRDFISKRGGVYFELKNKNFVANKRYGMVPKLRFLKPASLASLGLKKGRSLYSLVDSLDRLDFLKNPDRYLDLLRLAYRH
jgi:glucose-6-phosphate isomerase